MEPAVPHPEVDLTGMDLTGRRILVVEDDYFIAVEICTALQRHGANIVGPAGDIAHASALARREPIDVAVLDINLHGEMTFNLARELRSRGAAAILATGYDPTVLPDDLADVTYLEKPVNLLELVRAAHASHPRGLFEDTLGNADRLP
jgi:DNA-binding response OmpR family regulator